MSLAGLDRAEQFLLRLGRLNLAYLAGVFIGAALANIPASVNGKVQFASHLSIALADSLKAAGTVWPYYFLVAWAMPTPTNDHGLLGKLYRPAGIVGANTVLAFTVGLSVTSAIVCGSMAIAGIVVDRFLSWISRGKDS